MESEIEKSLKAMHLEEEDTPYVLPNLPHFSTCERNVLSIIGRTLNLPYQPMEDLIMDMPRKFRVQGRCRGIALSKERFQFIFKYKEDMDDVLDKGAWTFNDWSLIMEPWKEHPPEDFLKHLSVWIQVRNLPVNYSSPDAVMELGRHLIGFVKEVPYDPSKHQVKDYVRFKVLFDVNKPLCRAKVVDFPNGESVKLFFDFERVRKRCYACQRLTHDKASCPYLHQDRPAATVLETQTHNDAATVDVPMKDQDPLCNVLTQAQLGVDEVTGRPRIAKEVLAWMRQYIMVDDDNERNNRVPRIKETVAMAEQDPLTARKMLQLETPPLVHTNLDKGKGFVFNFETAENEQRMECLMKESYRDASLVHRSVHSRLSFTTPQPHSAFSIPNLDMLSTGVTQTLLPTGVNIGLSAASSSGTVFRGKIPRRRPSKKQRNKAKGHDKDTTEDQVGKGKDNSMVVYKRKAADEAQNPSKIARRTSWVVPEKERPNA